MKSILVAICIGTAGCVPMAPDALITNSVKPEFKRIESATGGRLGVALVSQDGRLLTGNRTSERFAFCSTFKLLLAGMVLQRAGNGSLSLDEKLSYSEVDLVFHSPITADQIAAGFISVGNATRAVVTVSDNAAANLLLKRVGGIDAFNAWLRSRGDEVTRLDRFEPSLNENAHGDLRDTTTPEQMARSASKLIYGTELATAEKTLLRSWLTLSETGRDRIRAGLPPSWDAGDKTGTCGGNGRETYNDVSFFIPSEGPKRGYVLSVFLTDRRCPPMLQRLLSWMSLARPPPW